MHYVLSPIGSSGDVHPMLGLACELQRRGNRVTVLVNGYFRELVERLGLPMVEVGTREQFLEVAGNPDLWRPLRAFPVIFRGIAPFLRMQYDLFAELYEPGQTVGVISCLGFGGRVAQQHLGIPMATLHLQPSVLWSDIAPPRLPGVNGPRWLQRFVFRLGERLVIDRVVRTEVNRLLADLGEPPMGRTTQWWHSPQCLLCMFPPWFAPAQRDWPPNVVQTGFPLWDESPGAAMPPEVDAFLAAGEPPVAFTPGSANVHGREFFEAAVEACARLERRGVLLTRFAEQVPGKLPEGVRHFSFVPFSQLLPRCAAMVSHGGIGTVSQALAAGVPQLIMPLAHDQFDNAARLQRLGVGDALKPSRFRGPAVAARLRALLESPDVAEACRGVAARFAGADGVGEGADALERFAADVAAG